MRGAHLKLSTSIKCATRRHSMNVPAFAHCCVLPGRWNFFLDKWLRRIKKPISFDLK